MQQSTVRPGPLCADSVTYWGIAVGVFPVAISTWNARAASDHAESAGALLATSFQLALAVGAIVGGAAVDGFGIAGAFSYCASAVFAEALVMLVFGRRMETSSLAAKDL